MRYIGTDDGILLFDFHCEGCGSRGQLGIEPGDPNPFGCPEGCGASYVLYNRLGTPALMCVVCPVGEEPSIN